MTGDEYRTAMKSLARETKMPAASAARIEQELLSALASREASDASLSNRMKHATWRSPHSERRITVSWRPWLPAAAAIVLVVAGVMMWVDNRPTVIVERWAVPPPLLPKTESPRPTTQAIGHDAVPSVVARASRAVRHRPIEKTSAELGVVKPAGFVALPWTAGLPAFESGEIVRMEVPVALLPAYGIDISPGVGTRPIEADLLIGQDGFARAIRLVTSSARSRQ
jgi:hypothetical protein